jgi:hypothetical protein
MYNQHGDLFDSDDDQSFHINYSESAGIEVVDDMSDSYEAGINDLRDNNSEGNIDMSAIFSDVKSDCLANAGLIKSNIKLMDEVIVMVRTLVCGIVDPVCKLLE